MHDVYVCMCPYAPGIRRMSGWRVIIMWLSILLQLHFNSNAPGVSSAGHAHAGKLAGRHVLREHLELEAPVALHAEARPFAGLSPRFWIAYVCMYVHVIVRFVFCCGDEIYINCVCLPCFVGQYIYTCCCVFVVSCAIDEIN